LMSGGILGIKGMDSVVFARKTRLSAISIL